MSKYGKIMVSISMFFLTMLGLYGFQQGQNVHAKSIFVDVADNYWAKEEIEYLYGNQIISGYEGNQFKPTDPVTRGQAAKMIINAIKEKESTPSKPSFSDIKGNQFSGYIERAAQLEIISGYDDNTYRPNVNLTRGQMSKIIVNAFDLEKSQSSKTVFTDVPSTYQFASYIQTLYNERISNGNGNVFEPGKNVTRAELSAFISRALDDRFKVTAQDPTPAPKPEPDPEPTPTPPPATGLTGEVTADVLNMRSGPGSSYGLVTAIPQNAVVTVHSIDGFWAKVTYNNKTGYVHKTYLKLKNTSGSVLQNRIITIDAGHGGKDVGAVNGDIYEKDIALAVAKLVEQKLKSAGAKTVMTRSSDTYPTLDGRVQTSINNHSEMFVSIHTNAATPSASGTETYYDTSKNENGAESRELAIEIQKQLIALIGTKDRGAKDNSFLVIREQHIPSVLVELAFISNSGDLAKLTSPEYQELFAEAIFRGIKSYYSK
ncbi:N-acetylmuramoyl-L-alanine amidase [Bacillus tuaregi]|uniref:N-acetylmuramoyl-L-alanine amidase n=1 Tax=Bacillus tuaregi TaxID=1816695 RepID=UPI0008F8C3FC|nr:N-acetylmuramoyl-L-alanine amidase [Bacillus tuaregi]